MGATSFGATGRRADHFNLTVPTGQGGVLGTCSVLKPIILSLTW